MGASPGCDRPEAALGGTTIRYLKCHFFLMFFRLIPWLRYRSGADPRRGIEINDFERRRSRGA